MHVSKMLLVVIVVVVVVNYILAQNNIDYKKEEMVVTEIIDGDTIKSGNISIRLNGINAPEKGMAKWKLSKNYLEKLVNKTIFLVWFGRKYDKYERRLGYIFYEKTNVNKELVRLGYAHVYSLEKNDLTDELIKVENQARNNKIGIWKKSNISNCINMRIDDEQEFALIKNKCKFNITTCNWTLKDEATHIFHFPCTTLTNTNNITVYSKNENNTDFSFGYKYVWNNDGDKAFLRDKNGLLASYAVV